MGFLLSAVAGLVSIASLVCFILVLIKMFQNGQTVLGIVCIIFCLIGILVAFIMGWVNVAKWNIKNVMLVWTGCIVVNIVLSILGTVLHLPLIPGLGQ
ncbi:MAG TPA: hypothetical protein VK395_26330 [Gemmataceae bacterium]|nr:hypothetical protein [Gemmataceae bacterium]